MLNGVQVSNDWRNGSFPAFSMDDPDFYLLFDGCIVGDGC